MCLVAGSMPPWSQPSSLKNRASMDAAKAQGVDPVRVSGVRAQSLHTTLPSEVSVHCQFCTCGRLLPSTCVDKVNARDVPYRPMSSNC